MTLISLLLFRIKHFLQHFFTAKGAHSLHSPFVFQLYNQVVKKSAGNTVSEIELLRKELLNDHQLLDVADIKLGRTERKTIASIAKTSLSQPKFSSFLRLLAINLQAETILETGTSLGLNALYLSNAATVKKVITIEGSPIISEITRRIFSKHSNSKVELTEGSIYDVFVPSIVKHKPEIIFLDADHRSSAIAFYLKEIITHIPEIKCIIIHDIYWSQDMLEKWNEIVENPRFSLTIDIFQAGLIFPNHEMPKQHFKLKF